MRTGKLLIMILVCVLILPAFIRASSIEVEAQYDFKLALNYAFGPAAIDTLILTTSGGLYTTFDTLALQILEPIVIIAAPGLEEMPIFRHSDADSGVLEIFRIHDDVTFEGIIFDGYNAIRPMKYTMRVGHTEPTWMSVQRTFARDGLNVTVKNCVFQNNYPPNWENDSGGSAIYFLRPQLPTDPVVKAGTVRVENCTFRNLADEAIRVAETEKYAVPRALDSLIVRNCTFKNIGSECIRFYADTDTSNNDDAYVLIEHLTIDSSAIRTAFIKNNKNTIFRDIIVSNSILPKQFRMDRTDYIAQVQTSGSYISHLDTFNVFFVLPYSSRVSATKGATVDTNTIYSFDPMYTDADAFNYMLLAGSEAYGAAHDGSTLGDLRWADPALAIEVRYTPEIPAKFTLDQNYPNPFNPSTNITFTLPESDRVVLQVYSVTGALIETLINGKKPAGAYNVSWYPNNISSGVYFYKLSVGGIANIKKMTYIK